MADIDSDEDEMAIGAKLPMGMLKAPAQALVVVVVVVAEVAEVGVVAEVAVGSQW